MRGLIMAMMEGTEAEFEFWSDPPSAPRVTHQPYSAISLNLGPNYSHLITPFVLSRLSTCVQGVVPWLPPPLHTQNIYTHTYTYALGPNTVYCKANHRLRSSPRVRTYVHARTHAADADLAHRVSVSSNTDLTWTYMIHTPYVP